jgi:UDP-2-acetamido-3-amino-2,3-dideoxy-glucuronate N-acetyltransferase
MTSKKVEMPNIAVIGSGYWGRHLVRNFYQLGALKMVCDRNEAVLRDFKEKHPGIGTCLALSEVLGQDAVAGVVIATPAETHFVNAREALLAGKHVFVEKPLVLDEAQGRELIDIAEAKGRVLMVGHLLKYHPAFVALKKLVMAGDLGRVNYIYSNRLNFGKIRREENILWSFAPHDISMILTLAGEMPESVLTSGGCYLHQRIADITTTHFDFASGLRAHIFVSWLHPFKEQKLVVVGDQKMAVFNDTRDWPDKLLIYPHHVQWVNGLPVPEKAEPERVDIPQEEPLRNECRHFLDCIADRRVPLTDGHEGLQVLHILNASQRSLENNGQRVLLDGLTMASLPETTGGKASAVPARAIAPSAAVHETAIIDPGACIGAHTKIWHFSHVLGGSKIGESCNIGQNVVIGPDVTIGDRCKIQNNVSVYKGVTLEEGVFCGPSMVFTNIINPRAEIAKMDQVRPTLVKKGATIGANATVVCGTTLGRYCLVGAGAVVTRNVPAHAMVVGNPARIMGWACACGERLGDDLGCPACGLRYGKDAEGLFEIKSSPSEAGCLDAAYSK